MSLDAAGYGSAQLRSLPVPDVVPGGDAAPQPVSTYQAGPASPGASSAASSRARRLTSLDMHPDLPEPQPLTSQQRQSRGALQPDHGPAVSAQDSSSAVQQLQAGLPDESQPRGTEQAVLRGSHAEQDEAQSSYHAAPVSDAVLAQLSFPGRASQTRETPYEAAAVQTSTGGYSAALPAAPAEAPQPGVVGPPASRVVGGPSGQIAQGAGRTSSQGIASLGQRAGRPHSARTPARDGGPGSGEHSFCINSQDLGLAHCTGNVLHPAGQAAACRRDCVRLTTMLSTSEQHLSGLGVVGSLLLSVTALQQPPSAAQAMQLLQEPTSAGPAAPLSARVAGSASHRQPASGRPASAAAVVGSWDLDAHRSNLAMAGSRIPEGSAVDGTSAGRPARPMSPVPGDPRGFFSRLGCNCQGKDSRPVQVWMTVRSCLPVSACSTEVKNRQPSQPVGSCLALAWRPSAAGFGSEPAGTSGSQQHVVAAHRMHWLKAMYWTEPACLSRRTTSLLWLPWLQTSTTTT